MLQALGKGQSCRGARAGTLRGAGAWGWGLGEPGGQRMSIGAGEGVGAGAGGWGVPGWGTALEPLGEHRRWEKLCPSPGGWSILGTP